MYAKVHVYWVADTRHNTMQDPCVCAQGSGQNREATQLAHALVTQQHQTSRMSMAYMSKLLL